jgi:hypothetical protein
MTANPPSDADAPNHLNMVVLSGRVESQPTLSEFDSMPPQLQVRLEIVLQPGYAPMTQPVIFMDPPTELVEEAMDAVGKWAYFTGRVMSAIVDDRWETHVMGSEIRFMEAPIDGRIADRRVDVAASTWDRGMSGRGAPMSRIPGTDPGRAGV